MKDRAESTGRWSFLPAEYAAAGPLARAVTAMAALRRPLESCYLMAKMAVVGAIFMVVGHGGAYLDHLREGCAAPQVALRLSTQVAPLQGDRFWLVPKVTIRNESTEMVKPLVVSLEISLPPEPSGIAALPPKVRNALGLSAMPSGHETETATPIPLERQWKEAGAALIRVSVILERTASGEPCIIDPAEPPLAIEMAFPNRPPKVCVGDRSSSTPQCASPRRACSVDRVQQLVVLEAAARTL